jgi:hypothetical protein
MAQRDYILRMIEQFGRFAVALRKLIIGGGQAGSAHAAERLRALAQHAGLDIEIARLATLETLVHFASPGGAIEPARCWMYAETLYLDGLDAETSGRLDDAWASYQKARALFALIAPAGAFLVGFPEAGERIAELEERLRRLESDDDDDPSAGGERHPRRRASPARPLGVA